MPDITILTPFRNASDYIVETAGSIFDQSFQDWEWILINDHSEENEEKLLKPYMDDPRVKLVRNAGKGIRDALVTGFQIVEGTFVTRMDADDIMPPNKLAIFLKELNDPEVDVVTGKVQYFSEHGQISSGYKKYEDWLNDQVDRQDFFTEIYRECTLSSGNWMIRTEVLRGCGGFDGLVYPEDYDLLFRWYQNNLKIKGVDQLTHHWREHPMRTSRNSEDYSQERFFELKIKRFIKCDLENIPLILNGTGTKGRLTAKILLEEKIPFKWVSVQPEKFKAGVYGKSIERHDAIQYLGPIHVLNATSIENELVKELYRDKNEVRKVVML